MSLWIGEIALPVIQDDFGIKVAANPHLPLQNAGEGAWHQSPLCTLEAWGPLLEDGPGLQTRASEEGAPEEAARSPRCTAPVRLAGAEPPGVWRVWAVGLVVSLGGVAVWVWAGPASSHCVWGRDEAISEGRRKLILESSEGRRRTASQVLEAPLTLHGPRMKESKEARWVGWGRAETPYSPLVPLRHSEERRQRRGYYRKSLPKKQPRLRNGRCFLPSRVPSVNVAGIQPHFLISQGLYCDGVNGSYFCGSYWKLIIFS